MAAQGLCNALSVRTSRLRGSVQPPGPVLGSVPESPCDKDTAAETSTSTNRERMGSMHRCQRLPLTTLLLEAPSNVS